MSERADSILRAITDDQAFRIVLAETTQTARGCLDLQRAGDPIGRLLADLVTGAVLFRQLMAPSYRVQVILRGTDGKSSLLADSHPSGDTRALVQLARGAGQFEVGSGSTLQLMRSLPRGDINQGFVEVRDSASLSTAFMSYMQASEQVTTFVALGAAVGDDGLFGAGGFMVQLLPDAGQEAICSMLARVERFGDVEAYLIDPAFSPKWMLEQLLRGAAYSIVGEEPVRCRCWCSEERVLAALATLDRSEVSDIIAKGEPLEIACDYCGTAYRIAPQRLLGLNRQS